MFVDSPKVLNVSGTYFIYNVVDEFLRGLITIQ